MVSQGRLLATLSDTGLQADLDAAEARAAQARADLTTIDAGGKQLELTTIASDLARVRVGEGRTTKENTRRCAGWPINRPPRSSK